MRVARVPSTTSSVGSPPSSGFPLSSCTNSVNSERGSYQTTTERFFRRSDSNRAISSCSGFTKPSPCHLPTPLPSCSGGRRRRHQVLQGGLHGRGGPLGDEIL